MYYLQFAKINTPGRLIERGRKKCGYGRRIGECVTEGIGPLSVFSPKEEGEQSVVGQYWWITSDIQKYLQYNHPCKSISTPARLTEIGGRIGE